MVGLALNAANYRGAVSALQTRMESYVYLVLAAMEVDEAGRFRVDEDFADPRLVHPGSGVYVSVAGAGLEWHSRSALGLPLPSGGTLEAGAVEFREPVAKDQPYTLRYGIGWQLENDRIEPFTVTVLVDAAEIEQQTSASPMPDNMVYPVDEDRVKTGIGENDFKTIARSRVSFENRFEVPFYILKESHGFSAIIHENRPESVCYSSPMDNLPRGYDLKR